MRINQINIKNFRGILDGQIRLDGHTVLIGDNNSGKSTILEAIDLVLGPERLSRAAAIDEHDFYAGQYLDKDGVPVPILVDVTVIDLTEDQQLRFRDNLEWWDSDTGTMLAGPPPTATDNSKVVPALRVCFEGLYDVSEDDFTAATYFMSPVNEDGSRNKFRTPDKRECGFLLLRTLRTGFRALSLERGSLLDIILKLQEKRLQMWEGVLAQLRTLAVAEDPELGLSEILASVQEAMKSFVPSDWGTQPHMRVSDLTRENLRKTLTVFLATGATTKEGAPHAAPFQHQGTGTINTLVLALLSMIADLKQNVIFAMEEPEIAIPPHTQRRIVDNIRRRSSQAIFTSHSPYVLEEFDPAQIVSVLRNDGTLSGVRAPYPPAVKPKKFREEMRRRFCESLLSRRVLIVEGHTEYSALPAAARRLHELSPNEFASLEGLGVSVINAETDSQIAPLAKYFGDLGKTVLTAFDKQSGESLAAIKAASDHAFESPESNFETLIVDHCNIIALRRYADTVVAQGEWPSNLAPDTPGPGTSDEAVRDVVKRFLNQQKADGSAADLLSQCSEAEMPSYIVELVRRIREAVEPVPGAAEPNAPPEPQAAEVPATGA